MIEKKFDLMEMDEEGQRLLAKVLNAQWIYIGDDLPDCRKMVLVNGLNPNTTYKTIVTMGMLLARDPLFWLIMVPKDDTVHMVKGNVTHWQNMPKGPR